MDVRRNSQGDLVARFGVPFGQKVDDTDEVGEQRPQLLKEFHAGRYCIVRDYWAMDGE